MKRIALCIGNDEYKYLTPLSCCISDAEAIGKELTSLGFDTIVRTNLNRESFIKTVFDFINRISEYDSALFYFAGHGFQIDETNILAPIDLNINDSSDGEIKMNAFPLPYFMEPLERYPEKPKIIILDTCRSYIGAGRGGIKDFTPISAPQGTLIAFSTSPGGESKESITSGHGRYTEALLKYIALPRVPIETMFKTVREHLFAVTNGKQIPWEHTSLIGEFYVNPDTIYDAILYSDDAKADSRFRFYDNSEIGPIVDDLKSSNWYIQSQGIAKIGKIGFINTSSNELFILGRNIYQSACGDCYASEALIENFRTNNTIPKQAKIHVLNGMAYEIYFDSKNNIRHRLKDSQLASVIRLLEYPEYYACREFIASQLYKIEDRPIYIPGQNEKMLIRIIVSTFEEGYRLDEVYYQGKNILCCADGTNRIDKKEYLNPMAKYELEHRICNLIGAPFDCTQIEYNHETINNETVIYIPFEGFCFRFNPSNE